MRREAQRALELEEQIREDAQRQRAERARLNRTRERSESDATETGLDAFVDESSKTVAFHEEIVWEGLQFSQVRLFHPQKGKFVDYSYVSLGQLTVL